MTMLHIDPDIVAKDSERQRQSEEAKQRAMEGSMRAGKGVIKENEKRVDALSATTSQLTNGFGQEFVIISERNGS